MSAEQPGTQEVEAVTIKDKRVYALSPEGLTASMELEKLIHRMSHLGGRLMDTGCVLPDGVKLVRSRGAVTVLVYERPPQVYSLKWIAGDSPVPFGRGTKYREVRIALPYLIVLAVFVPDNQKSIKLSPYNECFFRVRPLRSTKDELSYPALLNCSRFDPAEGRPLSWVCTSKLAEDQFSSEPDDESRIRTGLRALLHCLLETGYNHSSEHHEKSSWFTESTGVDPRVSTIENWEKATKEDQLFVLDVPWLRTGLTLGLTIDRIFQNLGATHPKVTCADDVKRILFNQTGATPTDAPIS